MTPTNDHAEITAYVMALTPEQVCSESATKVMGWTVDQNGNYWKGGTCKCRRGNWRPSIDRNQSRMVTNMIGTKALIRLYKVFNETFEWESNWDITADQETRAALIAHMIHMQEAKNATEQ